MLNKSASFWIIIFLMTCIVWVLEVVKFFCLVLPWKFDNNPSLLAFFLATLSLWYTWCSSGWEPSLCYYCRDYSIRGRIFRSTKLCSFNAFIIFFSFNFWFAFSIYSSGLTRIFRISISEIILKLKSGWIHEYKTYQSGSKYEVISEEVVPEAADLENFKLSVIIPCFNEEETLITVIRKSLVTCRK